MQSNNNHLVAWLHERGISDEVLRFFNVEAPYKHPTIGDCIRIPYSNTHSKYRRDPLDERKPKYLYDTGGKVTLYGADKLSGNVVVVTEGELDTLVLWSKNIPAVSSTGGALSFQEEWASILAPYQVYVCFDNDDAGAEGMVKVLQYIPDAKIIFIPEQPGVKDISDFVSRGGDFHALMATARSFKDIKDVEDDRNNRKAQWLPTRFHDKYIDKHRQQLYRSTYTPNPNEKDEVLRAKQVPMTSLMEFTRRKACCPFHNERTPSFHYYPKTNSAYCFGGCGRAYDVIDVYRNTHNCSFPQAISDLNKML